MTGRRSGPVQRGQHGQATVEIALGLPVVLVAALVVLQLALVGRDRIMVSHAAREAARAAATDPGAGSARDGAVAAGGLDPGRLQVESVRRGDRVVVTVRYRAATELPLVGALIPDPWLTSSVTIRDERAPVNP